MLKPVRVLFALSVAATTIGATTSGAHAAQAADVVQTSPAPGSRLAPKGGYFLMQLHPGDTVTQQISVKNPNNHSVVVDVRGVDASTSGSTGASYGVPQSRATGTGTWVTFVTQQLQLQPGEHRTVPFTITVPSNIGPGQYLAGVSVAVPLNSTASTVPVQGHSASFRVTLEPQRVIAVEVVVPGPRAPHLAVTGVRPVVQGDTLRLQFDVANTGNAFGKGHGTVTVADTNTRHDFTIDTFVSHTAIKYMVPWTKNVVPGVHSVTMRLQDQTGRIVAWTGTVDVSGAVGSRLQHDLAAAKGASAPHSGGTSLKWLTFLIVPVCIAAAVHLHRRRSTAAPVRVPASTRTRRGATATPPRNQEDNTPSTTDTRVEARASR